MNLTSKLLITLSILSLFHCKPQMDQWTLINQNQQATIYLPPGTSEPIQLAVQDLASDVQKITGQQLKIVNNLNDASQNTIIIVNLASDSNLETLPNLNPDLDSLSGQWESYVVTQANSYENIENPLLMVGSDERGTIFAIYHFIEKYLQVDPFYYWTGMEPEPQEELVFDNIEIIADEPDFKYRGWFNNDEDLITEFFASAGQRDIDYRYYGQVVHP
ncbi:MAG: hypothetical protein ACNS62_21905, partial [Candidatus Cyclobacteriaceae bacterium M3_2C_046]